MVSRYYYGPIFTRDVLGGAWWRLDLEYGGNIGQ